MSKEFIKAINRLAKAIERSNNPRVQRELMRVRADELLKTLEDKATVARVTAALEGITRPEGPSIPSYPSLPAGSFPNPAPITPLFGTTGQTDNPTLEAGKTMLESIDKMFNTIP